MRPVFGLVAASLLLLSGCDGERAHLGFGGQPPAQAAPPSPSPPPRTKAAKIQVAAPGGLRFDPETLDLRAESLVEIEFQNRDAQEHTFVVSELAIAMLAGPEQTVRSTLPEVERRRRGRFSFFCSIPGHRDGGMEGTLRIR